MNINLIDNLAEKLKKSKNPVVIWGCGALGKRCMQHLESKGVQITGFVVNKKFYNQEKVYEYPVYILEEYIEKNYCDVIMAFEAFSMKLVEEQNWTNIHKLHIYDYLGRFVAGSDKMITNNYLKKNEEAINYLYNVLEDDESRVALMYFLQQRMMSNYGKPISDKKEYFGEDFIALSDNEVLVDCGAFDGDSIELFFNSLEQRKINSFEKIYAFEPDENNYNKLIRKFDSNSKIEVSMKGVWSENGNLKFETGRGLGTCISDNGSMSLSVTSIDNALINKKVTFIKMDIEGAELEAIKGAVNTIRKNHPKMAICVYHKKDDLFVIPKYIKELNPDYKLYLRNYQPFSTDLILYAV